MLEITYPLICAINKRCLKEGEPFRVLDKGRLESALGQQQFRFLYNLDEQVIASVFRSLIQNHPFENGNKRTAVLVMEKLAESIGKNVVLSDAELTEFVYRLADAGGSKVSVNAITNKLFGTDLDESLQEAHQQTALTVFHSSDTDNLDFKNIDLNNSKEIGIHCGTELAARQRKHKYIYKLYLNNYNEYDCNFDITSIWSSQELVNYLDITDEEKENLINSLRKVAGDEDKYYKYSKIYRDFFLDKGYNLIKYKNEIEDKGSTSYIILDTKIVESQELIESLQEARQQTALKSNGVYSILNDTWIKEPVAEDIPELDKEKFDKLFNMYEQRYFDIIRGETFDNIDEIVEDVKQKRLYEYSGPIYRFKRLAKEYSHIETLAVSFKQAVNNIKFKAAQEIGYNRANGANVEIRPELVREVELEPGDVPELHDYEYRSSCPKCGRLLNDSGECPLCDLGDETTLDESEDTSISFKIEEIEDFIEDIYDLRKESIKNEGEYGTGNLVFKELRAKGYLDNLRDLKNKLKSKELSLY